MLNALFSFIYKTIAIGSTAVIGVSIAFYIGGIVTESMIKKSNEDDEESDLEMDEIIFEEKYDDEFNSLEVKDALPKEEVEKFVSTVETPIGDVVMKYDLDAETFHYFSDRRTIPIRFLDVVCKKFVIDNDCKVFYKEEEVRPESAPAIMDTSTQNEEEQVSEPFYMKFWNSYVSPQASAVPQAQTVPQAEIEAEAETEQAEPQEETKSVFATYKKKVKKETNDKNENINDVVKIMNKYKCLGTLNDYENYIKKEKNNEPENTISFAKFREMIKNKTE